MIGGGGGEWEDAPHWRTNAVLRTTAKSGVFELCRLGRPRNSDREIRPLRLLARDLQSAAVLLRDPLRHRQTQSCAATLGGVVGSEDPLEYFGWNARAGI